MAMVSMCFQLMQDEISAKVRWLLSKCGFGKKDGDKSEEKEIELPETETKIRPKTAIRKAKE